MEEQIRRQMIQYGLMKLVSGRRKEMMLGEFRGILNGRVASHV